MKSSSRLVVLAVAAVVLTAAEARAAGVDFKDPRRALGREDDIRVDAQLAQDTVSSTSPISVTYQIQNLTASPIAIADRVCDSSFDPDTQTITISIGAEIPEGTAMPHLVLIAPGQTRSFRSGAAIHLAVSTQARWLPVPRNVQITVNILRDLQPFAALIEEQSHMPVVPLSNELFDQWVASVSSVPLNSPPVRWSNSGRNGVPDASQSASGGSF